MLLALSEKCKALHFLHAFNGCDMMSSFAGWGKKTVWETWMPFDEETSALSLCSLGSTPDQGSISAVQLLVVHFYDHTNSAEEVNEARKQLFTLKRRAKVTFIPPTQAALQKELLVGHVWRQMFIPAPNLPSLTYWSHQICTNINSLGPIADISTIISTICFRRHNLCKKCQNLTKFSHIEEYKKPLKNQWVFAAPCC